MAEKIKLSVEADKDAIYVYDTTGSYDAECNLEGWGAPNLNASDIEEVTVEVFPPESESGIIIDVSAALPSIDGLGFEIIAQDLGLSYIVSGSWRFVYRVKSVTENFEQAFSVSKYFDEVTACCVDSMINSFDTIDLTSGNNKNIVGMEILFDGARHLACKGNAAGAQKVINHVNLKCNCCK